MSVIAAQWQVSEKSVRRLLRRFEQRGAQGTDNDYHHCGQRLDGDWKQRAAQVRHEHPDWGAEMIRLHLLDEEAGLLVPSGRTLQRWLRQMDLQPARQGRRPKGTRPPRRPRADQPHQHWQIDAAEGMKLKCHGYASWLRIVDECSGAFLMTEVFAAARWEHVDLRTIRHSFRKAFARWGLPQRIQFDNGYPWGSSGTFPPVLALWLIGLGVDVIWSWPACPQENGVVERSQGTGKRWAEPWRCCSAAELQRQVTTMDRLQRERYPYRGGTRWEMFPGLAHSGRRYTCRDEPKLWQLARVLETLSQRLVIHRVDRYGGVSLYHYSRYVGKQYAGQPVYITLDPTGPTWVFSSGDGVQWRTHPATELTKQRIVNLDVSSRKGHNSTTAIA